MFFRKPTSPPLNLKFFLKSTRPSLPLKKAPPLISVFFNSLYDPFGSPCRGQKPQGRRGNRPTRCSNRCAIRLADHQRSTPAAELRFLCGDEPAFTQGFAKGLLARCFFLKSTRPSFIDKAGCTRQFESELSLRSLAQLFPIKEGSFENPPVLPYP